MWPMLYTPIWQVLMASNVAMHVTHALYTHLASPDGL
jgi:hypothetical protein